MAKRLFTSESVTEGHPDKVCDQISDAILDDIIAADPMAHVACETFTTTGMVVVMGEITTSHYADIPGIARRTIERIGYTNPDYGFDYRSCAVMSSIDKQSPDIAMGVNQSYEHQNGGSDPDDLVGAGDQGMMFGYACDETPELMPAPIALAHQLCHRLTDVRKAGAFPWLRPDGKSQVTVEYGENGEILRCPAIVVSTQHDPDVSLKNLREAVTETIIKPVIPGRYIDKDTKIYVNPTGRFVVGGPVGGTGLTGRKIIVDTYGGSAAQRALPYAIGVAHPVSILVDTYGTGSISDEKLSGLVGRFFDFRPAKIIEKLDLRRPIYEQVAAYGHFGRTDLDLSWERTDMVDTLKAAL